MAKIIPFTPAAAADLAAQHLYLSVAAHTQAIEHLLDNIAFTTVSGAETRADLARSAELLSEARALLERVEVRESPKYLRSSGANRWD